jgi:hypothetical protein
VHRESGGSKMVSTPAPSKGNTVPASGRMLPWESDGRPRGTGICLSGGGLRAASFAFGAVQALQEDRGLLYGERSADFLAVVSGGSYLAASELLNANALRESPESGAPPLGETTPEAGLMART